MLKGISKNSNVSVREGKPSAQSRGLYRVKDALSGSLIPLSRKKRIFSYAFRSLSALCIGITLIFISSCVSTVDNSQAKPDPRSVVEANVKLGMAYLQKDNRDNALRAFSEALKIDKRSAEAHHGMALVHQLNGEYELAEKSFKRALKGRADFSAAGVRYSYARYLYDRGDYSMAKRYFDLTSQELVYPHRAEAFAFSGLCAQQLGDSMRAKALFKRALSIDGNLPNAAIEMAEIAYNEKNYESAKKYLDRYFANASRSPRSLLLGIRIERVFDNKDREASFALALKNLHPYSKEYLEYKKLGK